MEDKPDSTQHELFAKALTPSEATLLTAALQAEGIDCYFKTEDLARHIIGGRNSLVFVAAGDFERARAIQTSLNVDISDSPTVESAKPKKPMSREALVLLWILSASAVAGISLSTGISIGTKRVESYYHPAVQHDLTGRPFRELFPDSRNKEYVIQYLDGISGITEERHSKDKGQPANFVVYFNPKTGDRLKEEYSSKKNGKIDLWIDYDENGRPARRVKDVGSTGAANYFEDLDGNGQPLSDKVLDGEKRTLMETTFKDGIRFEERFDLARKGKFDTLIQFDKFGVPIKISALPNH